jgi:hypothetical protein
LKAAGAALEKTKSQAPASAGAPKATDAGSGDEEQAKIKALEAKLAEYSIIEDDLVNLKRLQQENTELKAKLAEYGMITDELADAESLLEENERLKAQLAGKGITPAAAPPKAKAAPSAPAPTPPPAAVVPPPEEVAAAPEPEAAVETAAVPQAPSSKAGEALETDFEGLVDKVEESLMESPQPGSGAEEEPAAAEPSAPTPPPASDGADLIGEFEKLLNSS